MQVIEVKRIDTWDGGERHNFHAYVSNTIPDDEINKQKQYRNCHITPMLLTVFDSLEEIEQNSKANLRKSAYAKLTPLEREAIDLKL